MSAGNDDVPIDDSASSVVPPMARSSRSASESDNAFIRNASPLTLTSCCTVPRATSTSAARTCTESLPCGLISPNTTSPAPSARPSAAAVATSARSGDFAITVDGATVRIAPAPSSARASISTNPSCQTDSDASRTVNGMMATSDRSGPPALAVCFERNQSAPPAVAVSNTTASIPARH